MYVTHIECDLNKSNLGGTAEYIRPFYRKIEGIFLIFLLALSAQRIYIMEESK